MARERGQSRWHWAITHFAMSVGFASSLLWLRGDFLPTIGGGVALMFFGGTAEWLRLQNSGENKVALRLVILGYLVMGLNLTVGLVEHGAGFPWVLLLPFLALASVWLCMAIAEVYFPFEPPYVGLPGAHKGVVVGLIVLVVLTIVSQSLTFVDPLREQIDIGIFAMGTVFLGSILTGGIVLLGLRAVRATHHGPAARRMLLASPLWLVTGSVIEILRGNWTMWLLSAASVLVVEVWVYVLTLRSPSPNSVRTGT